jgi:hypothetical protein
MEQPMISKQMDEDFETLLSVEIKLRLLDTEGVDISKEPPEIPMEPEVNFIKLIQRMFKFIKLFFLPGLRVQL